MVNTCQNGDKLPDEWRTKAIPGFGPVQEVHGGDMWSMPKGPWYLCLNPVYQKYKHYGLFEPTDVF